MTASPSSAALPKAAGVYLQDHLAGSTLGINLAKRLRDANRGTELGRTLETLAREIDEDREKLREIMSALGVSESKLKNMGAWIGERLSRLKLNGSTSRYSDLARLIELETLHLGVGGKVSLWRNLQDAQGSRPELGELPKLIERAEYQEQLLEQACRAAAVTALTDPEA